MKIKKLKKTKKPQPIIHLEESAKYSNWRDALAAADFVNATDDNEWRLRLIDLLYKWADEDDALELQQFLWRYKIPVTTFYQWKDKYADINCAWSTVKNQLACRRRIGVMNNKLHYQSAYRDMHLLAFRWAEDVDKYHADLAAKITGNLTGIQVVEIERYPDSPLVPHKKSNDSL